jgi:hypothetical protein
MVAFLPEPRQSNGVDSGNESRRQTENIKHMKTQEQLKVLTGSQLVELYNDITGDKIKKFRDSATGIRRVLEAQEAAEKFRKTPSAEAIAEEESRAESAPKAKREKAPSTRGLVMYDIKPHGDIKPHRENTCRGRLLKVLLHGGCRYEELGNKTGDGQERGYRNDIRSLTQFGYGLRTLPDGRIQAYTKHD